jgi:UDP-N-acetylmuramoyl-tripeptide--D-alanyl-D-alanine ligase
VTERFDDAFVRAALRIVGGGEVAGGFPAISTDTRRLPPGALFVALVGERFDGHDHLAAARDAGARAAVVRRGTPPVPGLPCYAVDDTLVAYGELAHAHRMRIRGPVIAITGQNGKTSTKEMLAAALGTRWRTHRTPANDNNLVGVPQTILAAPPETEALVIEAGANLPGEIARYRAIIAPDIALVLNAGAGHLEGFGSVAGVVREKLELARDVPVAIVGVIPPGLADGARARGARRVITAGLAEADVMPDAVTVTASGAPRITKAGHTFTLAARGLHQAGNAMFAWAVAEELGLDLAAVAHALERFTLPGGRGEVLDHGRMTIVHDGYNANPDSFRSAIALADAMRPGRRLVVVAGTMRELGTESAALHQEVAGSLARLAPEVLALVGDFVPAFAPWRAGFQGELLESPDAEAMGPLLAPRLREDDLVVLKGSRGTALERILPAILARAPSA